MLNRRITAFLLVAAMALTLCGASVFAADPVQAGEDTAQETMLVGQTAPSATVAQTYAANTTTEEMAEEVTVKEIVPDAVGTLSFPNLASRIRENNFTVLALEESINSIKAIDYEEMTDDMRKQLNAIARGQWQALSIQLPSIENATDEINKLLGNINESLKGLTSISTASASGSYAALKDTFEDLKDGEIQEDNDAVIRQLENTQDQLVMAGESIYVALLDLEVTDRALERQRVALDRTIEELELRYKLGQVSALTLQETKAGRTSLVSGQETLRMNIKNLKIQLELMVGAELDGEIQLQALPQISASELSAMNLEKDLAAAKEISYDLYAAKRTLDDAQEDFKDAGKDYVYSERHYEYVMAKHTWEAAQYTYSAAVQNFESSFNTLYLQVKDYQQILEAAKVALASKQASYAAMQLKYEQGTISHNKLLDSADELSAAQETVESAAIDLFSAYTNYRWAVDYGIMN